MAAGAVPVRRPGEASWRQSSAACWAVGTWSLSSRPWTCLTCSQLQPLTSGCFSSWSYTWSFLWSVENKNYLTLSAIKYIESFSSKQFCHHSIKVVWKVKRDVQCFILWLPQFFELGGRASIVILRQTYWASQTHTNTLSFPWLSTSPLLSSP